jgi:hypothetical protein
MNPRHERFWREYVKDYNGTAAAIRAGLSRKSARQAGSRMLTISAIQEAIHRWEVRTAARYELNQDKIIRNIIDTGDAAFLDADYGPALKAQEMLGRHIGMWPNVVRNEVSGPGGGPLRVAAATVVLPIESMTPEQREALRTVLLQAKAAAVRKSGDGEEADDAG